MSRLAKVLAADTSSEILLEPRTDASSPMIAVTDALDPGSVIRMVHGFQLRHVVQKDGLAFDSEMVTARLMEQNPHAFFERPMEVILGLDPAVVNMPSLSVLSSMDEKKSKTIQQFESFLLALPGARTIRDAALVAADELYTNGTKASQATGTLRPGTVEFFARSDGSRLVFGCKDTFGELGLHQIVNRMHQCFERGVAQAINNGTGGAGIGSFMVFNSCTSYYAAVEQGRCTIVCVAMPIGMSYREAGELPKNIHLLSST